MEPRQIIVKFEKDRQVSGNSPLPSRQNYATIVLDMKQASIRVLGGLEIEAPGETRLHRKAEAVVAFLAMRLGQPQTREKIAGLFWQSSSEEQARANLRQCLSTLRKRLGDALVADTEAVTLDPSLADVDLERFNELVHREDRDALEQALDLYTGDLLDGFAVKEDAFENLLWSEREKYRDLFTAAALKLTKLCEDTGDISNLIKHAARLVAHDPLNERTHRALMRAYAAQGRYDAALRQFETCRKTLERELAVQPQRETINVRTKILKSRRTPPAETPTSEIIEVTSGFAELGVDFSLPSKPSIILLPFRDLSANGDLSHIAEGIRIDVQSNLVKISGLFVIAAGNAAIYADRDAPVEQVSKEMGVRYVLEGSVQGNAKQLRVSVQLSDIETGSIIWSERYDRPLDDQFLVQDEIMDRIVTALDVELVGGEQTKVWRKTLRNPKALEIYYRALDLLSDFDESSVAAARQMAEKVSAISPDVTLGPTLVAFCHYWDVTMGWSKNTDESLDAAEKWAEHASAMEDASGEAHAILAHIYLLRGRFGEALKIAEEAVKIRPLCAMTNALAGNVLLHCGQPVDAIARVRTAIRAAPVYASWWVEILAAAYRDAGDFERAIAAGEEAVRANPTGINGHLILISALVASKNLPRAHQSTERLLAQTPDVSVDRFIEGAPYKDTNHREQLKQALLDAGVPK